MPDHNKRIDHMHDHSNKSELKSKENKVFIKKSQSHSFDVENACLYGIECAVLINHFQFWIEQNQVMGRNFHDGRTWMYQTQKEIAAIYPYWNRDKVQDILQKLEDFGVIIKGNYNKTTFDKTSWYAFKNEEMFTKVRNRTIDRAETHNPQREIAQPIPYTKTDTKQKVESVAEDPPQKINILSAPGKEVAIEISELYQRALIEKKPWRMDEMKQAWEALSKCKNIVYDWWRFIEGTIKNIRLKQTSMNLTKGVSKWKNKKQKENQKSENILENHSEEDLKPPVLGRSILDALTA